MSATLFNSRNTSTPGFTHPRWSKIRFFTADPASDGDGGNKPDDDPDPDPDDDEELGEGGKKALKSERDRRKAAEGRAKDLEKQIEDSKKTAEQLSADELKQTRDLLTAAETRAMKFEVAAEAGLELKLAARLTGATREELLEDAKSLKELVGAKQSTNPKPDPNQGGGSHTPAKGVSAGRELHEDMRSSKKK